MNCAELDVILCDYMDGTLDRAHTAQVEEHLGECAVCAELARDASAALDFIGRAEVVEPPPELLTRILFETRGASHSASSRAAGLRKLLGRWLQPMLQPKFAMGMAMTILSFVMLGRFAGIEVRQLKPADLDPARIVMTLEDRVHRGWDAVLKYYESLRLVYEIQTRLKEWTEPDDGEAPATDSETKQPAAASAPAKPGAAAQPVPSNGDRGVK